MRKLIYSMSVSLDGYIAGPNSAGCGEGAAVLAAGGIVEQGDVRQVLD